MKQSDIARMNLELMELFTQEMLYNEELARSIPKGAAVFILPDNDPELAAAIYPGARAIPSPRKVAHQCHQCSTCPYHFLKPRGVVRDSSMLSYGMMPGQMATYSSG